MIEKKRTSLEKLKKSNIAEKKNAMYRRAIRKIHKEPVNPGPFRKRMKRTAPEMAMIKILEELGVEDFEVEFPIYALKMFRVYDFRIGDDLLIEVDGDYIHGNREAGIDFHFMHLEIKKNDALKNVIARSNGYDIMRFWQSTIENDPELVKERLRKRLQLG